MGIRLQLSRLVEPSLPENEELAFSFTGSTNYQRYIITSYPNKHVINCHKWYFPHPRKTYPEDPAWTRGPGFKIPYKDAGYWANGLRMILELPTYRYSLFHKLTLYQLNYKTIGGSHWSVRFFVEQKHNAHFWGQVQAFSNNKPSGRVICWRTDEPQLGSTLLYELECAERGFLHGITVSDKTTTVEIADELE